MNIRETLANLHATSGEQLTADELAALDENGYLELPGILSDQEITELRRRLELLTALEGEVAGKEVHQEAGTARLSNLVDKGFAFRTCFSHPKVLAAVAHVLGGDLKLSSLNARTALPGSGLQPMHVDWGAAVAADDYQVCNSIWLLDDFTPDNGATRVVPGSHRWGRMPHAEMPAPMQPHPREQLLLAPAGTVVVFNSHTWHGGTLNRTDHPRRAAHAYFSRRALPPQLDQRHYLSRAAIKSLSPEQRCILDVE